MRLETAHHFLRSRVRVGLPNWWCSEVFAFGVNPTEMILGRSGGATTIQFTGGGSAYKVVDEAS
jgi:hypothetical protein